MDTERTTSQDAFVAEFVRLLDEGWEPDPVEYVGRVPEESRMIVAEGIREILRLRSDSEPDSEPEAAEPAPLQTLTPFDELMRGAPGHRDDDIQEDASTEPADRAFEELMGEAPTVDSAEDPPAQQAEADAQPELIELDRVRDLDDDSETEDPAAREPDEEPEAVVQPEFEEDPDTEETENRIVAEPEGKEQEPSAVLELMREAHQREEAPGPAGDGEPEPADEAEGRPAEPDAGAQSFINEFVRLLDEGWDPDPEEFVQRIPEPLHAEVQAAIEDLLRVRQQLDAHAEELVAEEEPGPVDEPAAPSSDDLPVVPGFRIESLLGEGALGRVYAAIDESLQRRVALKVLHTGTSTAIRDYILREARRAASLQHPAIVTVHSIAEGESGPALVMECIDGFTLDQAVEPLTFKQRARICRGIAEGLAAAHAKDIIHRDLKPQNILVTAAQEPKILDFGLALSGKDRGSHQDVFEGSPLYASPEQAAKAKLTSASDIFSFGSVLYTVLTGRPPFEGATRELVLSKIKTENPAFPRELDPRVPADLQSICLSCLARNPKDRPTARELAADLGRFLAGEPARLRPVMYRDLVQRSLTEHQRMLVDWENQGIISGGERDHVLGLYRRIQSDEDHWIFDDRRISRHQTVLYSATWLAVVAVALMVYYAWDSMPEMARWIAPTAAWGLMTFVGLLARFQREKLGAASFLSGSVLASGVAGVAALAGNGVFADAPRGVEQLFTEFTNLQVLTACGGALLISLAALWFLRMTAFAWTTMGLAVCTYWSFLLTLGWLDMTRGMQALWLLPMVALVLPGIGFERLRRFRWAVPFHVGALAALVGALDYLALDGEVFRLMEVRDQLPPFLEADWAGFALNAFLFLGVMIGTEHIGSLHLRRSARWLQILIPLHLITALTFNAQEIGSWSSVILVLAAAVLLLVLTPWRSRRWFLTGGLSGLAIGVTLPLSLDLIEDPVIYTAGIGLAALVCAIATYLHMRRRS